MILRTRVIMRSHCDPRCHLGKIKTISSDWIALLRRLLVRINPKNKAIGACIVMLSDSQWHVPTKTRWVPPPPVSLYTPPEWFVCLNVTVYHVSDS